MTTTDASTKTAEAGVQGTRLIRRLVVINLGPVALQALSAGFLMSGYARGEVSTGWTRCPYDRTMVVTT